MEVVVKKLILLIIFLFFFSNNILYASSIMPEGKYLEMHQWGALEDILSDWKSGSITTDECVLYGCRILALKEPSRTDQKEKIKSLPSKYNIDKKSLEEGPYFFVNQIYKNETLLSKTALNEFYQSEWSDFEFLQDLYNNNRLETLISQSPVFFDNGKPYKNYANIIKQALEQKIIMPETVYIKFSLAHINKERFTKKYLPFMLKHNLRFIDNSNEHLIDELLCDIAKDKKTYLHNRKLINLINYFYYAMSNIDHGKLFSKENAFNVVGIGIDDQPLIEKYRNWLNFYKAKFIASNFKEPLNFVCNNPILTVHIVNGPCPIPGFENSTASTQAFPAQNIATSCLIEFFLPTINANLKFTPHEKQVIHELMHSITYSYDSKATTLNDYHWYLQSSHNNSKDCIRNFEESSTSWAEDYFYESNDIYYKKKLSTIFKSNKYFFVDYSSNNFSFPAVGMFGPQNYHYSYSYFFRYLCAQYGNDFIKKLWENIETNKFTDSFAKLVRSKNSSVADVLHEFAIKNYYLAKIDDVFPDDEFFKTANKIWGDADSKFPLLEIKDAWLPNISSAEKKIPPYGTKIYKLLPPDHTLGYFDKCVTLDFSWNKDVSDIKFSVVSCWNDIQNSGSQSIGYLNTPLLYGGQKARYQYFTKKGLNPTQFIILVTNGDITEHSFTVNISYSDSAINPALTPAQLIGNGGTEFINATVAFYESGNFKASANRIVNELKKLFESYSTLPKSDSQLAKDFIGQQIIKKLNELNLVMHTAINQMHDLRYQYYLYKKSCIEKILKASSPPALDLPHLTDSREIDISPQLTNLNQFMTSMNNLYNPKDEKTFIYAFHAFVIRNHAYLKIAELKHPANWTDKENELAKTSDDLYKKFNSIVTGKNFPYWYSKTEMNEAINIGPVVGTNEDEAYNIGLPNKIAAPPAPVNFCPNPRTDIQKKLQLKPGEEIFIVPPEILNMTFIVKGIEYKASKLLYLHPDTKWACDPLSLRYFSSVKKHDYHENNMPPKPTISNVKSYVASIGYYMNICKSYALINTADIGISNDIIIKGAADRIIETISYIADTIIDEKKSNETELYESFKSAAKEVYYGNEALDLLEKQLRKEGTWEQF